GERERGREARETELRGGIARHGDVVGAVAERAHPDRVGAPQPPELEVVRRRASAGGAEEREDERSAPHASCVARERTGSTLRPRTKPQPRPRPCRAS